MSLQKTIEGDIKNAMLEKRKEDLLALRAIKSAILIANTEKGHGQELTEDQEMKLLTKLVKQRNDSAELYEKEGRQDLADKERLEMEVIKKYLPEQMSETEIEAEVKSIIAETGASSMKDMGRVMGMASKKLAGKADGKTISGIVKSLLS